MTGLLDRGAGLVRAALEDAHALVPLVDADSTLRALADGALRALIVETHELDRSLREVLEAARARSVPVLVVARDRSVNAAVEALRSGATDYLAAPFEYDSLERAIDRLRDASDAEPAGSARPSPFVTRDPELLQTLELVRSIAASDATVLIEGESGTGKELLAQLTHRASPRRERELVCINCAALPPGLLESELFGHERGAFTGATHRTIGKFELAHGATILLDEIGELELRLQAKLLRVLQEKQVQRVGAQRPVDVDFRLVATTNRDLRAEVAAGQFREDLFYRLNVLPVRLKPLRERPDDVEVLLRHFLERHRLRGRALPLFPPATLEALRQYHWPGNVRELENVVERAVLTLGGGTFRPEDLHPVGVSPESERTAVGDSGAPPFKTIREMERWLIVETLVKLEGNRTRAARELGISLRTLRNKIHDYTIVEPETLPRTGIARSPTRAPGQISPGAR